MSASRAPARFGLTRCSPVNLCLQRGKCQRFLGGCGRPIDGSVTLAKPGAWCPMFIDARGAALLEAS